MLYVVTAIFSLCLSIFITKGIVIFLVMNNVVENLKEDRWHKVPVPKYGGVAIVLSFSIIVSLLFVVNRESSYIYPYFFLVGCSFIIFLLGLFDDIFDSPALFRLVAQIIIASVIVKMGYKLDVFPGILGDYPNSVISLFWFVGLTNAFNMIDNMDGVTTNISIASLSSINIILYFFGISSLLLCSLTFIVLGFLVFNKYPATIFLGDCGSTFLGFIIAGFTTTIPVSGFKALLIPFLLVVAPVVDCFFVTITRLLRGQSPFVGDTTHLTHRLSKYVGEKYVASIFFLVSLLFCSIGVLLCV